MFRKAEPDVGLVFVPMSGALFYSDVLDGSADVGFYFEGDQALADYGLAVSRAGIVSSYYAVMTDACPPPCLVGRAGEISGPRAFRPRCIWQLRRRVPRPGPVRPPAV